MDIPHILIALLIFGFLVFIHELGHFIVAKRNGVRVYEFAVGMGPSIFKKEHKDTLYTINIIPLGGYVRMSPFQDKGEVPCAPQDDFNNKTSMQKIAVAVAGPLMNVVFALFAFILFAGMIGVPTNKIAEVLPEYPGVVAGLHEGDEIISVNSVPTQSWEDVVNNILKIKKAEEVHLEVISEGEVSSHEIKIVPIEKDGRYMIGISPVRHHYVGRAVQEGFVMTWNIGKEMLTFVKQMFTGKANTDDLSGPVGIIQVVSDSARSGLEDVLYIAGIISLNLAILNLLPIPALDGSRILVCLIEILRRGKRIPLEWENRINLVGFAFLLGLMAFLTYKDIARIIVK